MLAHFRVSNLLCQNVIVVGALVLVLSALSPALGTSDKGAYFQWCSVCLSLFREGHSLRLQLAEPNPAGIRHDITNSQGEVVPCSSQGNFCHLVSRPTFHPACTALSLLGR